MDAMIENMTGSELLLLNALYGPETRAVVDRELDRRALFGPPSSQPTDWRLAKARVVARRGGLQVA